MGKVLVYGAGAIGRGYLPWVVDPSFDLHFIDVSPKIVEEMQKNSSYTTFRVHDNQLESKKVPVASANYPEYLSKNPSFLSDVDCIFISVGPRNCLGAAEFLKPYKGPIVMCENDPATVDELRTYLSKKNVFFAVPDVITSNTAPEHLLREDPLAIVSEDGELFVDEAVNIGGRPVVEGDIQYCSESELLNKQWVPKLFLHNTPHCVVAYLGALVGARYVHEAMAHKDIAKIVRGAMTEMLKSLKLQWNIPHEFLDWYADKELARFSCPLLFDPITRVAREPLRKLELEGRLIGASQICLSLGVMPENIMTGIAAALLFDHPEDPDHHLGFMRKSLDSKSLLTHVVGLREGEALERALRERLHLFIGKLERIQKKAAQSASQDDRSHLEARQ